MRAKPNMPYELYTLSRPTKRKHTQIGNGKDERRIRLDEVIRMYESLKATAKADYGYDASEEDFLMQTVMMGEYTISFLLDIYLDRTEDDYKRLMDQYSLDLKKKEEIERDIAAWEAEKVAEGNNAFSKLYQQILLEGPDACRRIQIVNGVPTLRSK